MVSLLIDILKEQRYDKYYIYSILFLDTHLLDFCSAQVCFRRAGVPNDGKIRVDSLEYKSKIEVLIKLRAHTTSAASVFHPFFKG